MFVCLFVFFLIRTILYQNYFKSGSILWPFEFSYFLVNLVYTPFTPIIEKMVPFLSNSWRGILQHQRIHGGAKGACAPRGSEAKTVKSACFWLIFIIFHHSALSSTLVAWNSAYASVQDPMKALFTICVHSHCYILICERPFSLSCNKA